MKITPRMKSSLIQVSAANIFFLIVFLGLFLMNILPGIKEVSEKKELFGELYNKSEAIKTSGMTYAEYTVAVKQAGDLDVYTKSLLKDMSPSFYNDNFTNNSGGSYDTFIEGLQVDIQEKKGSESYVAKDTLISTVLPSYSQDTSLEGIGNNITDFDFINTVENILYNFNLGFIGEIGVGNLENIESEEDTVTGGLSESIFKIPLQLSISGRKRDIVDFVHYFETVGTIDVIGDSLEIYEDTFISSELSGEGISNIYKAQFADIETLQMQEYPDSSSLPSESTLIEILSAEQGKQRMDIDIAINFYLAGVPEYQMEQALLDYFSSSQELEGKISQSAKQYAGKIYEYDSSEALLAINKLSSLNLIMQEMSEETIKLKKQYGKKEGIEEVFQSASELMKQLGSIELQYEQILPVLQ